MLKLYNVGFIMCIWKLSRYNVECWNYNVQNVGIIMCSLNVCTEIVLVSDMHFDIMFLISILQYCIYEF